MSSFNCLTIQFNANIVPICSFGAIWGVYSSCQNTVPNALEGVSIFFLKVRSNQTLACAHRIPEQTPLMSLVQSLHYETQLSRDTRIAGS
jgi:hypothetical protein